MTAEQIAKKILSLTESGGGEWAQMQIASLGVELAECVEDLAKDAARYRFLRDANQRVLQVQNGDYESVFGEKLDAAIDREGR